MNGGLRVAVFASVALSRCLFFPLSAGASGCAPDRAVPFLCLPKEKEPKEKAPCSPVGPGPTALRCSVLGVGAETRFVACGHCAQTSAPSQLTKRAARATPKPCAARRLTKGPK